MLKEDGLRRRAVEQRRDWVVPLGEATAQEREPSLMVFAKYSTTAATTTGAAERVVVGKRDRREPGCLPPRQRHGGEATPEAPGLKRRLQNENFI